MAAIFTGVARLPTNVILVHLVEDGAPNRVWWSKVSTHGRCPACCGYFIMSAVSLAPCPFMSGSKGKQSPQFLGGLPTFLICTLPSVRQCAACWQQVASRDYYSVVNYICGCLRPQVQQDGVYLFFMVPTHHPC